MIGTILGPRNTVITKVGPDLEGLKFEQFEETSLRKKKSTKLNIRLLKKYMQMRVPEHKPHALHEQNLHLVDEINRVSALLKIMFERKWEGKMDNEQVNK